MIPLFVSLQTMISEKINIEKYTTFDKKASVYCCDFKEVSKDWESPTVIISDGPYGIGGFPGDPETPTGLGKWYEPHIKIWSKKSTPITTLWFWNTEVGWANVHPVLIENDWEYVNCHTWNKGKAHVAGNANTKTLRKLPLVTEVCVQYVKKAKFVIKNDSLTMQEWLRYEWKRTGLPFSKTNDACGVKNAASRKYFTKCHLWYFPPADAFEKIAKYANENGKQDRRPYFSLNGKTSLTKNQWEKMRAKFKCPFGITNVWDNPPLNGKERLKNGSKALHLNQKPLKLMDLILDMSSEVGDIVWEPFGGLCSGSISSYNKGRISYASEVSKEVFEHATNRLDSISKQTRLNL